MTTQISPAIYHFKFLLDSMLATAITQHFRRSTGFAVCFSNPAEFTEPLQTPLHDRAKSSSP